MKKFIALGVGALASASLVLGASPVKASPAEPVVPDVCESLPLTILNSNNAEAAAAAALGAANTDLANKRAALNSAVADWVTAFANHLVELDEVGGTPGATQILLDDAAAEVTEKVTPWGNAKIAQWNAQHALDIAQVVTLMNATLNGALPCV